MPSKVTRRSDRKSSRHEEYLQNFTAVRDIEIDTKSTVNDVLSQMSQSGGFQAKNLGTALDTLEEMCSDEKCVKFLSFPAAIISTGNRGIIKEIVKRKLCDVIITTCGTLDHDVARSYKNYLGGGDFAMDDADLERKEIHRLGNVLVPRENYGPLIEEKVQKVLSDLYSGGEKRPSTRLLCEKLGDSLADEKSILHWASKNKIPVYVPGIADGAVGSQCWLFYQMHRDFNLDLMKDEQEISDIVYSAKSSGALMLGGGISKHHTLWWNQFRGGLDYAVYITSATELDGSLSGAQVREAISWGKVSIKARQVTIFGEVTSLLPFLTTALIQRLESKQKS
ncbi:MAG TPA: deoxyhypusine synthase [Nitrososphaerales archaeon]|nr:deoxyhypusine synthase [Nitrososphaerales archaeon]